MSIQDNLQAAFAGEGQANRKYLAFATQAEAEGHKAALVSFRNASTVEKTHYDLYSKALTTLGVGKDLTPTAIHVCDVCGRTVEGEGPDKCPVCGPRRSDSSKSRDFEAFWHAGK